MSEHLALDVLTYSISYAIFIMSTLGAISWYRVSEAETNYWNSMKEDKHENI